MDIEYAVLEKEIIRFLDDQRTFVLATSAADRVTARSMSCVNNGLTIYFQTDKRFLKCDQIKENPLVAMCAENVQIEGKAVIGSQPLAPSNKEFIDLYKVRHPSAFNTYSHLEHSVVVKVDPIRVTLWKYRAGKPYREFLLADVQKAVREAYDISR